MNGGVNIVLYESFGKKNRVLVVVTFPAHESDQRVLAESQYAVLCGCTVCQNISGFEVIPCIDNRLLVVAVGLVGAQVLDQLDVLGGLIVIFYRNSGCINENCGSGLLCNDADAGISCSLLLHAGSDNRGLGCDQRHTLTLHVGAHQCTVRVIVLKERYERCCDREYHPGRHVHVLERGSRERRGLRAVTSGCIVVCNVAILIQHGTCLCNMVVILFVRRHVNDFVGNARSVRILLINLAVRSLDKAVLVDLRIGCQRVDQTDVRSFRSLDGAHASIVRIVNVSDLEACTVS